MPAIHNVGLTSAQVAKILLNAKCVGCNVVLVAGDEVTVELLPTAFLPFHSGCFARAKALVSRKGGAP